MNHKFKNSIVIILIYCMGIGCITFFMGALYPVSKPDDLVEAMKKENEQVVAKGIHDANDASMENKAARDDIPVTPPVTGTSDIAATPSPSATPTPPPVYELTEGGHPEIEKFFHDFYVAWNSCDYNLIKSLTTDPDNAISLTELQRETRFLDDIRDNTCYIMKSYEDNAYIVYVYHEIKYINIKTPLPRLDKFYLVTDDDGNFKIFTSEMDETLKAYYDERNQDDKVQEIIEMTNDSAKEALEKDVNLRVYVEALYNN